MNYITQHEAVIAYQARSKKKSHKSIVLWFTGLSGSGKSTLAYAVEERLYQKKYQTCVLDGDSVRSGISSDLGFSDADRKENIRRVGEVSKLMLDSGVVTLVSLISPYHEDRQFVRKLIPQGNFLEIYCKAALSVCEKRDVKGYYKKARSGEIKNYTGINSAYETPINADLEIDTERLSIDDSVDLVLQLLIKQKVIV